MSYFILLLVFFCAIPVYGYTQNISDTLFSLEDDNADEKNIFINENNLIDNDGLVINTYDFVTLKKYSRQPLSLNAITQSELDNFYFLSPLQKKNFLEYKNSNGLFININELQKIPYWDRNTIQLFSQYVVLNTNYIATSKTKNTLLIRNSFLSNKVLAYKLNDTNKNKFFGIPYELSIKYNVELKNVSLGFLAKQDAGESFQKLYGFDFYSFFSKIDIKNKKIIRSIYLGDYTLQIAQGLIEWQRFQFNKSQEVINVQKSYPVFQVHNSLSSINFKRGIALDMKVKNLDIHPFFSYRNLDGNIDNNKYTTTLLKTGYHRSRNELNRKNNIQEIAYGWISKYNFSNASIGVAFIKHDFNTTIKSNTTTNATYHYPYASLWNANIDYTFSYRSISFFGETAIDKKLNFATLNGFQISLKKYLDIAFIQRYYSIFYLSVYANPFRETTSPNNENGLYMGIRFIPTKKLELQYYLDWVNTPWLVYGKFSSTKINEHFFKILYTPTKKFILDILATIKNNQSVDYLFRDNILELNTNKQRSQYKAKINYQPNPSINFITQFNIGLSNNSFSTSKEGFSYFNEFVFNKINNTNFSLNFRVQYFDIMDNDVSIYLFERDVLRDFTINYFNGKGWRYYGNIHYHFLKKLYCSIKWSQFIYERKVSNQNYTTAFNGKIKGEIKFQIMLQW